MTETHILKMVLAAVAGILLGLEREMKRKPLGLKTCVIICVTSCLLTFISTDIATLFNAHSNAHTSILRSDPERVMAQIVSGIGFIGAGAVIRRNNEVVSGLTTAAMVWASAGLGIAIGVGFYAEAFAGLVLFMASVELVPFIMKRVGPRVLRDKEVEMTVTLERDASIREITEHASIFEIRVEKVKTKEKKDGLREVKLLCIVDRCLNITDLYVAIEDLEGVVSVEIENL